MKALLNLLTTLCLLLIFAGNSYGIPAFARKYQTSCMTCHNGFPKMNAFGEAFRRNGYQFPGGTDPEFIKEEPVSLGSEGNKRAFPNSVWPGSIPGSSPIAFILNGEMGYNPKEDPRFTFSGLGSNIEAVMSGTFGDDLSFWGHFILNEDGTLELNRMFMTFSNIIGNSYALNARVGVFEPGLFSFSTHRSWMEDYWLTTRAFSDDMGWTIEEFQKGIELNGMVKGRFGYNAGIVEGFGKLHADKDYYGHVTYKFSGMPLAGLAEGGKAALDNQQPYIDNSLTIGAFGYLGKASIGPDTALQDNKFTMFGGDFNAFYDRYNLFGGIGVRHDDRPFVGDPLNQSANSTTWFTELNVVAFPWLLPGIRFESWQSHNLDFNNGKSVSFTDNQIVPGVVTLLRPNVKMTIRASFEKFDSRSDTKFTSGPVMLVLTTGL